MNCIVYVISIDGKPLMPTTPGKAKWLLRNGKAKVKRTTPFTIKLTYRTDTTYTQPCALGIDTGSKYIGSAVVNDKNQVIYMSQVEVRNNISKKMTQRKMFRVARRHRKTRYRPARWLNRNNSIKSGRFSPTMVSKIESHMKEIAFVRSILPITKLIIETGTFDPHLLKDPTLITNKWGYQHGPNYGFENVKAMVLDRDKHICQLCNKNKVGTMEVHHIIYRSNHGSNDANNLITLCHKCHHDIHEGIKQLPPTLIGKAKGNLKYATQMNSIRIQLMLRYPEAIETFGFITKANRQVLNLPKEHFFDAVVIVSEGKPISFNTNEVIYKKCVPAGDYQQSKGEHSEKLLNRGKINGFLAFDKVKYMGKIYFIKGNSTTSSGPILMDIHGVKLVLHDQPKGFKTANYKRLLRINARKSWIIGVEKYEM